MALDPTTVQTLVFSKEHFRSMERCQEWAKAHDFRADKVDDTGTSFRLRQRDPGDFQPTSFRTIELMEGVQAVVGNLKRSGGSSKAWLAASSQFLLPTAADPYAAPGDPVLSARFTGSQLSPWLALLTEGAVNASGEHLDVTAEQIDQLALTPIDPEKNDLVGTVNHASLNRQVLDPNGAVGYIRALKAATRPEDGLRVLLAKVEWTAYGKRLIEAGAFTRLSFESNPDLTAIIGFGLVDRAGDPDSDLARVARAAPVKEESMADKIVTPPEVTLAALTPAPPQASGGDTVVVTLTGSGTAPPALVPTLATPVAVEPHPDVVAARAEADSLKARLERLETERRHEQHERLVSDLVLNKAGESRLDPKFQPKAVALLDALAPEPRPLTGQAGEPADTYSAFKAFLASLPARSLRASGQSVPESDVAAAIQHGQDLAEAQQAAAKMGRSGPAAQSYIQEYLQREKRYSAQAAADLSKGVN